MENLVPLHHFLGVSVAHRAGGLFLSQQRYMVDILARAGMSYCKPCTTLADTHAKVSGDGAPVSDGIDYIVLLLVLCTT